GHSERLPEKDQPTAVTRTLATESGNNPGQVKGDPLGFRQRRGQEDEKATGCVTMPRGEASLQSSALAPDSDWTLCDSFAVGRKRPVPGVRDSVLLSRRTKR